MKKLTKQDYRRIICDELKNVPESRMSEDCRDIVERYLKLSCFKEALHVFLFSSLSFEVDTSDIADIALNAGKHVYYPRILTSVKDGARMEFFEVKDRSDLKPGHMGIPEPEPTTPVDPGKLTGQVEMIVPGVCFDIAGHRIGQGGGYYDRYNARPSVQSIHRTSLIYDLQLVSKIPDKLIDETDESVDMILTESRLISLTDR